MNQQELMFIRHGTCTWVGSVATSVYTEFHQYTTVGATCITTYLTQKAFHQRLATRYNILIPSSSKHILPHKNQSHLSNSVHLGPASILLTSCFWCSTMFRQSARVLLKSFFCSECCLDTRLQKQQYPRET